MISDADTRHRCIEIIQILNMILRILEAHFDDLIRKKQGFGSAFFFADPDPDPGVSGGGGWG